MRLQQKGLLASAGGPAHIRRKFDQPHTPFDRLCATGILASDVEARIVALRTATNPRQLRPEIYRLIERLLRLPCARPDSNQDVSATLADHPVRTKGGDSPGKIIN